MFLLEKRKVNLIGSFLKHENITFRRPWKKHHKYSSLSCNDNDNDNDNNSSSSSSNGMLGPHSRLRPLSLSLVGLCATCNDNNNKKIVVIMIIL